jgi:hypothetical protein
MRRNVSQRQVKSQKSKGKSQKFRRSGILAPLTVFIAAQTGRVETLLTFDFCLLTFDLPFPRLLTFDLPFRRNL